MRNIIPVYKPRGQTPYETVLEFKKRFPEYLNIKVSYAGRLDPMAEGLLLLLAGDENKNRKKYEGLQKTYEFSVLFGVNTDTFDILGKVRDIKKTNTPNTFKPEYLYKLGTPDGYEFEADLRENLTRLRGKMLQSYPPYSSKSVNGKPLYWWARHGKLNEIKIPSKEIEIFNLELLSVNRIPIRELENKIYKDIQKVRGDFRQKEIIAKWRSFFKTTTISSLPIVNCRITCSSGTYVRGLASEFGQKLNIGAIALSIKRTSIGDFSISTIIKV